MLSEEAELAPLGIYVYTYQTGKLSGNYSISDIVDDLKESLFNIDKLFVTQKQLIFVCHSMGGIVVRKFLTERILDLKKKDITVGLFLVASPSVGSDYANYARLVINLVGNAQAKALGFSQENNWLNDLDKEFKNLKESGELNIFGKELVEDKAIIFKKFLRKQIVEPFSAARYFGDPYKVPGSDHASIAKPVNSGARQHELLLEFIKRFDFRKTTLNNVGKLVSDYNKIAEPDLVNVREENADEHKEELKKWQQKLIQRLTEQLKHPDIEPIVLTFTGKLREDFPDLPQELESVASHLVIGDGNRNKQVAQFLASAQHLTDKSNEEPVKSLMAYLLQILVRKCHEEDEQGLTRIPVEEIHSVKLVGATRTTFPYIPIGSPTENQEHENGQRNAAFQNIGKFIPETGELENVDTICQEIAYELLLSLGELPKTNKSTSLDELKKQLSAYRYDPENSPVQGIYVKHEIKHNPINIDGVASNLRKVLGDLLWIYIYGGQDSGQWLYAEEGEIHGLISRYNREIKKEPSQQNTAQTKSSNSETTPPSVFVSYSRDDHAFVLEFVTRLKQMGLQVILDDTHLKPGEKIEDFIRRAVKESNTTICIVSRASLISSWVAMETVNTFHLQEYLETKKFIGCFLEDDFFKPTFRIDATKQIDKKIYEINALIPEYNELKIDTNDLNDEKTRLIDLRHNLGEILTKLKNSLSLDFRSESLDSNFDRLSRHLQDK